MSSKAMFIFLFFTVAWSAELDYEDMHPRHEYLRTNIAKEECNAEFWLSKAQQQLRQHLKRKLNTSVAKNLIMFLGDGMSITTLTAARMLLGDENKQLSFEKFPYLGLSKTYCVDAQTADSACSATAYLCGVKANDGTIGVTANVTRKNCEAMIDKDNQVSSLAQWSLQSGKAAGIVTTTRVTHASPSGAYAHTADRNWESDSNVIKDNLDPAKCPDIAEQLINKSPGIDFKVILGGGRKTFLPKEVEDEEGAKGVRSDKRNLIDLWKKLRGKRGTAEYVWNKKQLQSVDPKKTDFLLGLFESDHCKYHLDVEAEGVADVEPSLSDMVEKAIDVLSQEKEGFFLFVEGGRIDHAHHDTLPRKALDETIEFSKAVETALSKTNDADTLIVVTSDHAHTMTMAGYPERGNDIFGVALAAADDRLPMATLTYANGPGYNKHVNKNGGRKNYAEVVDTSDKDFVSPSIAPLSSETHGGDDVAVFASGPWAHLFTGTYEQNTIPHMMAYAADLSIEAEKVNQGGIASIRNPENGLILMLASVLTFIYNIYI